MRDRQSSSPVKLFIPLLEMASVTCTSTNVNELLPGLDAFLRSMVHSNQLDTDHRQIAAMYVNKLDQLSNKPSNEQQQQSDNCQDDQSSINGEIISEDESDDFTDEEEEQRKKEVLEQQQQQQSCELTPTTARRSSTTDNQLYQSTRRKTSASHSQWYIDVPKNAYLEASVPLSNDMSTSITSNRMSISTASSTIIADGILLTYDENHNWIGRYYVLDDFDLICFFADKKTLSENDNVEPLWVSDMTNAKVHTAVVDKTDCLCLQIGLAEAIYVRPPDPSQMHIWLKAFRDAASSQKSKDSISKGRSNKKSLSRNARRMFSQFNRKKGQIVSHLLDQMATVTRVDEKTRKQCELRGFLVVSLDNITFVTKYCTIVDGLFRVHKSRLSEQTDHELCLARCTLSFPEERTRDIQFALIDDQVGTIFIRGNNIYSMGRLLNTLAKYVEITGSSSFVFTSGGGSGTSTPLSKHRSTSIASSQPHIYSDVGSSSSINGKSNEIYSPASVKSLPAPPQNVKTPMYRNAAKLHDDDDDVRRPFALPTRRHSNDAAVVLNERDRNATPTVDTYDRPKFHDHVAHLVDRNNNHVITPPQRYDRQQKETKTEEESKTHSTKSEHRSTSNGSSSHRSKSKAPIPAPPRDSSPTPSSPEKTIFCLRSSDSPSQHRSSRRRHHQPHPPPRRSLTQTTPTDYVNKLANLFTKSFTGPPPPTSLDRAPSNERDISTQTYEPLPMSIDKLNQSSFRSRLFSDEQDSSRRVYDIPIMIERPIKSIVTPFEQYQKPPMRTARSVEPISPFRFDDDDDDEEEETPYSQRYDNLTACDGVGKFRFVIPFNHSSASAFTTPATSKSASPPSSSSSSTISSFSTIHHTTSSGSSTNNPNTNNNNSNARATTLMTAV